MKHVERVVIAQEQFTVQISYSGGGIWEDLERFEDEDEAKDLYRNVKVRLVQQALIEYGSDELE